MPEEPTDVTAALAELRARLERIEASTDQARVGGQRPSAAPRATDAFDAPDAPATTGPTDGSGPGGRADAAGDTTPTGAPEGAPVPATEESRFWLLDGLARHTGPAFSRDGVSGSVIYGGQVAAPGVGELRWQMGHPAPDVAEADLEGAAQTLAALGHPFRLRLLRRLLMGASTLAELQEPAGQGTSGQIHHHRELRSAGLVVSRRRNHYEIPAERVIPLLVIVAASLGRDLGTDEAAEGT